MSFRFNFLHTDVVKSEDLNAARNMYENFTEVTSNQSFSGQCDFVCLSDIDLKKPIENVNVINICELKVKYLLLTSIKVKTEDKTFSEIDVLKTDIIPGKYEGGLKIWECSLDLSIYLGENKCVKNGDSVLELGCGAGLPGIVAYLMGANVTFQDFNLEVLKYFTIPNTLLNTPEDELQKIPNICQYLYGDWESIRKKYYTSSEITQKYDVILTSETIYEKLNQKKLLELMKSALKPDGRIYVAAKIHYFGVGGGIADFEMLVKTDGTFDVSLVKKIEAGVERQILMMKYKTM